MTTIGSSIMPLSSTISTFSEEAKGVHNLVLSNSFASAAFPAANLGVFFPITLRYSVLLQQFFWYNGSTATGNIDIGIYTEDGTKIISSGNTGQTGTSVLQLVNVTDTQLGVGNYYLALASSSASSTFFSTTQSGARFAQSLGIYQQASASPLPATATFASYSQATAFYPYIGFSSVPTV